MVLAVPRTNVSNAKAIIIVEICKCFVTCFELFAFPQISKLLTTLQKLGEGLSSSLGHISSFPNIISVYFVNTFT